MSDTLEWMNYHHLLYFWTVAREGGLVQAGKKLHLTHSTLSAQIHALEAQLGDALFQRVGRRLVLTETGRVVYRYAEEIFSLGRELLDTVRGRNTGQAQRLDVGVVDAVPKLVVRELLRPALALSEPVKLVVHEASFESLLASLSMHTLDIVISDAPVPPGATVKAHEHLLGETSVSVFGPPSLAAPAREGFPRSLDGAPMVLPLENANLRRAMSRWFDANALRPKVTGEFEDSALMKVFGADGLGLFLAPTVVSREVCQQYGVEHVGEIDSVRERFYAVSLERRLKLPAVQAISDAARQRLFAKG